MEARPRYLTFLGDRLLFLGSPLAFLQITVVGEGLARLDAGRSRGQRGQDAITPALEAATASVMAEPGTRATRLNSGRTRMSLEN